MDIAPELYRRILDKAQNAERPFEQTEPASVGLGLGVSLRRQGRAAEAAKALESALREKELSANARILISLELGKTYDRLGRRTSAQGQYRRVLALEDYRGSREEARRHYRRPYQGR